MEGEKGVFMPGRKYLSTSSWYVSQHKSTSSRSQAWYPLVSTFCAPTLESTSSLISIVPSCLEIFETRARWLFKTFCLSEKKGVRGSSGELIVISRTRSFTVKVTESTPKLRDHSITSLETEKITLFYCRLEVYEKRMEQDFCLTVSTNGELTQLCHEWNIFRLFWLMFGCAWLCLAENFLRNWWRRTNFTVMARFLQSDVYHHQTTQLSDLVLKMNI